jgi:hypothetical protein
MQTLHHMGNKQQWWTVRLTGRQERCRFKEGPTGHLLQYLSDCTIHVNQFPCMSDITAAGCLIGHPPLDFMTLNSPITSPPPPQPLSHAPTGPPHTLLLSPSTALYLFPSVFPFLC